MSLAAENFGTMVSTWSDLSDLIEHFSYFNGHDWLFRGVTDAAYGLVPKIGREKARKLKPVPGSRERMRVPYRLEDESAVLFAAGARPSAITTKVVPNGWRLHNTLDSNETLTGQIAFVAAWFAVEKGGGSKKTARYLG